ncbi:5183_t:CDS:2 [Gigaspora margarita]|uniref:5183_t:CDS:1 n=1 Tax=Gigaspora margarita TaxID=4874 RepID=A0ABN7VYZ9_GIGMA|nr:5183_t:CDS:2 [Gigaspora margarita]
MSTIREHFFNVNEMFELSTKDFNKQWALVDNIWTRFNGYLLDNGDECKTFVCRLSKPKESSGRNENVPPKKLCVNNTPNHSHLIEECDMRKRLKFIKDMVSKEAIKDYKPPTIANVIRTEVSKKNVFLNLWKSRNSNNIRKLIAKEVHTVSKRLEEEKCIPVLASTECLYKFFNQYMLPYHHIFHKQLCKTNILISKTWSYFQRIFEESGMEVYQIHSIVEVLVIQKSLAEKAAKKSQSKMNELFERT